MWISPPPRSRLTSIQIPICVSTYIQVASHLHSGPDDCILALSRSHLTPSMSGDMCLTSVHFMSHFQSSHQNCIAASSRSHHTSIQAPGFVFHLQPVVSRSREFHFISIQLPSQPHTHLKMCVLPLFRSRLTSLQTRRFVSRLHPGQSIQVVSYLHVGPENCISAPWGSHLTPTEVSNFASHLHPGHISTPSSF